MSFYNSIKLIVNVIVIVIFLIVFIWFYREYKINRLNKRFKKYSILREDKRHSLFDLIFDTFIKYKNKLGKLLLKSKYLDNYSKKYEKYLDKDNFVFKKEIDFVTTKLIISFLLIFVLLVSTFFQYWFLFSGYYLVI